MPAPRPLQLDRHTPTSLSKFDIPVADPSEEESRRHELIEAGRRCARQDAWARLGKMIREADLARRHTPGGVPEAELIAEGARSDAVSAARRAVAREDDISATEILHELDAVLNEVPEDHGVAFVVAMAHIDIGWAWRGEGPCNKVPASHRAAFLARFKSACDILDRFDPFLLDAPMLAAARCALLSGDPRPSARVADDYEDLIDLAPGTAKYMRALGNHLLPRWFGSYEKLDREARRTMERTSDIWGAGGYTWVFFDALAVDHDARFHLDVPLFAQGVADILARQDDQHTVNQMAAFMAASLEVEGLDPEVRSAVTGCFDWIVRDKLRELHPRIWYYSKGAWSVRLTREQLVEKGRLRALSILSRHFSGT